jgi:hypothetical protein
MYQANRWTRDVTAWSHFICMAYARFTRREGLRDLLVCLPAQSLYAIHAPAKYQRAATRAVLANLEAVCGSLA